MAHMTLDGSLLDDARHPASGRCTPRLSGLSRRACVVHTHADACTALASLNSDLPPFHYMVVQFGGSNVRCAPYVTFGTPALATQAVKAMKGRTACLLANHGMILYARDTDRALARAVLLELCRQYLLALSAGKPSCCREGHRGREGTFQDLRSAAAMNARTAAITASCTDPTSRAASTSTHRGSAAIARNPSFTR